MITANKLNVGDKIYLPEVEEIKEYSIHSIVKDKSGVKMDTSNHYLRDCDIIQAISTIVTFNNKRNLYYFNIEDAIKVQYKLRVERLKHLQDIVSKSLEGLNNFTNKYFIQDGNTSS
jgi:hypothetical protein